MAFPFFVLFVCLFPPILAFYLALQEQIIKGSLLQGALEETKICQKLLEVNCEICKPLHVNQV